MHNIKKRQQISKGKLSVLALALSSALSAMTPLHAQTVINDGSLDTFQWNSGNLTITTTGIFTGAGSTAITSSSSTLGTLTNSGTVIGIDTGLYLVSGATVSSMINELSGTISNAGSTGHGLGNSGNIGTLTNAGYISGSNISIDSTGIYNNGTIGSLINGASGVIDGHSYGIDNAHGTIIVLNNVSGGIISGVDSGINNAGGTIVTLINSGTISGNINNVLGLPGKSVALNNTGAIGTINNSGLMEGLGTSGTGGYGVNNAGSITALNNVVGGTIRGDRIGLYNTTTGTIGSLNNSGLISGSAYAIILAAGSSLTSFTNTGTIAGYISNATGSAMSITGGTGSTMGTLTGYNGSIGHLGSTPGLTLSGNLLLNDDINAGSGTVTNNGKLQVNNGLPITGDYVQGSGSTLVIGVVNAAISGSANDTGYGHLIVTGNATLDGSAISITSAGYALAQGQRYVVVAATGNISTVGTSYLASGYGVIDSSQTETIGTITYNDLVLTLASANGNGPVNHATTNNANAALGGLFKYSGTDASLLNVFNPAAALGDSPAANRAGAQLSPTAVNSGALHAVDATTQAVNNVTTSHLDGFRVAQAGSSGVATGERARDIALWGQAFGGRASQGMRENVSGYHANYRGLLIGADGLVTDTVRVGGLFSAGKTSVASEGDNTGSSANINSYNLTAYGSYTAPSWYINALAGVARQQYSTVRDISYTGFSGTANGSFNGLQTTTAVQAGYPLNVDAWWAGATLTPLAGLGYSNLRQNGYTETGGSGAALRVNATSSSSLKSELGAKLENSIETSYGKLVPAVQVGWRHEFRDGHVQTGASFVADSTGATAFTTQSASAVANVGVLNLGVTLIKKDNLNLSARYTLETGGGYLAQTGSVQVRWQF